MANWTVLREKLRVTHTDPRNRSLQMRLLLRNDGGEPNSNFIMDLQQFLPGLTLKGPYGEELGYLPTWDIAEKFGSEEAFREELAEELGIEPDDLGYVLWVVFPEPVEPGRTITITLDYEDELAPSEGWWFLRSKWFPLRRTKGQRPMTRTSKWRDRRPRVSPTIWVMSGSSSRKPLRATPKIGCAPYGGQGSFRCDSQGTTVLWSSSTGLHR